MSVTRSRSARPASELRRRLFKGAVLVFISIAAFLCQKSLATASDLAGVLASQISSADAWNKLPNAKLGQNKELPSWARMLASHLPRSTAALLELDYAHRVTSPIPPDLRAAMRWIVASTNQCSYALVAASFDGKAAGVSTERWQSIVSGSYSGWSKEEQKAIQFARNMTSNSSAVTDAEFSELVSAFGEELAASMVLLTAYGNMQDRLLICLGVSANADLENGSLAPLAVEFDPSVYIVERKHPAPLQQPEKGSNSSSDVSVSDPSWSHVSFDELQKRLSIQREKPTRLAIPNWQKVAANLPPGLFTEESEIVWYRIVFGYAPRLAVPFERFMRTSGAETSGSYDRIFGTTLFWIVTRSVNCPYCMGHCEMNWEVAGLSRSKIEELSQGLAKAGWPTFPAREQIAFSFARKLSEAPSKLVRADLQQLQSNFGKELALFIAVHASRYNYMVRISNGFQLKLESKNVFFDYWKTRASPKAATSTKESPNTKQPFVALPTDQEAWEKLPQLSKGLQQPLPNFVKAVATQLPRTAAAMLELDRAHRLYSPLPSKLRPKLRWMIAKVNRCEYSQAYALADLKRAGATEQEIFALTGQSGSWPESERKSLEFVRLLTQAAPTISENLFEDLRYQFGDRQVAAIVLLAAYANFQDRIILGLNLPVEDDGPLPPLGVQFVEGALQRAPILPAEQGESIYVEGGKAVVPVDESWLSLSYAQLQNRLEMQRDRKPRLPIPTWEEAKMHLPPVMTASPTAIRWSLVNYGYAHELAIPWTNATRTHWAECPAERILEESLFWVQTRAIECNYCMGHCEMLLEAAGLNQSQIAERTKKLAETDWRDFPAAEQRAYAFARKLSQQPWNMSQYDYQMLVDDYGPRKAMGIFWWLCRGLYMTRISDGFQLPLERENVFTHHPGDEEK